MNWKLSFQKLPIIILVIWMALIAVLVWQRVCESQQPPLYDALSYMEKAKSFWDNISQGWPENPLNLVQPVRPPGTVLLSYPFGFTDDYRGFLFRTVFVPLIIWVIAILISAWPVRCDNKPRSYGPAVLAAFLLGPMPFFFQFECPAQAYWGLMDGFLASLAALAVACSGRSLMQKSLAWAVAAAAIASFCLIVKPSGSLVLLLTTTFWCGGALLSILCNGVQKRFANVRFWLLGTSVFFLLGGVVSWMCIHSQYLGTETVTFYKQAIVILQSESGVPLTWPIFQEALNSIFGPQIIIMVILGGFLICTRSNNCSFHPPNWVFIIASILFLLVGGWFWIIASGVSQVRYFYPFALMFILPLVIISFRKVYSLDIALPAVTLWGLHLICVIPALNLSCLLMVQNPNEQWQSFSGVSMIIGSGQAGVQIAKNFLRDLTNAKNPPLVYTISQTMEIYSFNCYGWYQNIIHPSSLYFNTVLPIDWQRPSAYRIDEIVKADYIIFTPVSDAQQKEYLSIEKINSLEEEEIVFEAFFSSLKPVNGLQTRYENQFCRLSKITDEAHLSEALRAFLKTKLWRPVFLEANEAVFKKL